jgi:hypothetical protein
LLALGGGEILTREPGTDTWLQRPILPWHATDQRWARSVDKSTGLFCVYVPGEVLPRKCASEEGINLVTENWIYDSILSFAILKTDF